MKRYILPLVALIFLAIGATYSADADMDAHIRFFGRMPIRAGTDEELVFKVTVDPASGSDHLSIELRSHSSQMQVVNRDTEIGQEFVQNVYFFEMPNNRPIVCVEWALGARSMGLTIYGLNSEKRIEKLFDESCDYGFQFVSLDGQAISLVAVDRLRKAAGYRARVFSPTAAGRFEEVRAEISEKPHQYQLAHKKSGCTFIPPTGRGERK